MKSIVRRSEGVLDLARALERADDGLPRNPADGRMPFASMKPKRSAAPAPPVEGAKTSSRVHVSIHGEINQIVRHAKQNEARVISIGPLILFSTESGDAWMLDSEDRLALCLARAGTAQSFKITETPSEFGVEWTSSYRIVENRFEVCEKEATQSLAGYPTAEILRLGSKWA